MSHQPIITDVNGKRRFACSAVALVNFIVNEDENVTILAPANRKWLLRRNIELYRLWNESQIDLQQLGLKPMG